VRGALTDCGLPVRPQLEVEGSRRIPSYRSSASGLHLVALTEMHARDFIARADQHDRESSARNIEALKGSGVMGATVPRQLGGLRVVVVAGPGLTQG
jgi:hypothetical protein